MDTIIVAAPVNYYNYIFELSKLCSEVIWIGPNVNSVNTNANIICIEEDPRNFKALKNAINELLENIDVNQIETPYEFYIENVARIREEFEFPGLKTPDIIPLRNKHEMKKKFMENDVPCAKHMLINNPEKINEIIKNGDYPYIFKPLNNAGCRGIIKVNNEHEARIAYNNFFNNQQLFQAEEYIEIIVEGSYDVIVEDGKVIFGTITEYEPTIIDTVLNPHGHRVYLKNDLPENIDCEIRNLGAKAIAALNIQHSFAHIEYFIDKNNRVLINEVGARIPGANIPLLINYSQDFSTEKIWAHHLLKMPISVSYNRFWQAGIIFLTAENVDFINKINGWDSLYNKYKDEIMEYSFPRVGDSVKKSRVNVNDTEGYVIVKSEDSEKMKSILDDIFCNLSFT
ncbi:ATP-grasp domain-containing protein [Bacillus pumilus]|uniref:ATP-grasp domain-containing protein n=1 Tax=Bacillus pumilus TaxID=1408 RepID=UPI0030000A89